MLIKKAVRTPLIGTVVKRTPLITGPMGPPGDVGPIGPPGPMGAPGQNAEIERLEALEEEIIKLRQQQAQRRVGGGGHPTHYQYTPITTATYTMMLGNTVPGTNIFGVNYAGAVTITLPAAIPKDRMIIINDESGAAGTNNITVQVPT